MTRYTMTVPTLSSVNYLHRCKAAFTLIEMVCTLSMIAVVSAVTVPAMNGLTQGTSLSNGALSFSQAMNLARSEAIARHRVVRFAVATDWKGQADEGFKRYSLWQWDNEQQKFLPLTAWEKLPEGVALEPALPTEVRGSTYASNDASSIRGLDLLNKEGMPATFNIVDEGIQARVVDFLPSGGVKVPVEGVRQALFVLTSRSAPGQKTLSNWAQVNVDALTGRTRIYRP